MTGALDARISTGDVHLRDVTADASAVSSVGDVQVDLAPGWSGPRVVARCKTGDVRIRASGALRAHVDAHTRIGDVRNGLASADVTTPTIDARSTIGDVTISTR